MKKKMVWLTMLSVSLFSVLFILGMDSVEANGIISEIKSDSNQLKTTIDGASAKAVALLRYAAIAVAIALFVWMMVSLFVKNDSNSLFEMKKRLGGFAVALIGVFFAEKILGTVLGIFNITMPQFIQFIS